MAREQSLESKINASTDFLGVLSLGSVVLSGILLFTPVKAIGYIVTAHRNCVAVLQMRPIDRLS